MLLDELSTATWLAIGPAPIDTPGSGLGLSAGRAVGIARQPTDENTVYIATDGGGIWKTTTWGSVAPRWTPLTDGQLSLNAGGYHTILVHPASPDVVIGVCGGSGVLRSDTAGQTWALLGEGTLDQGGQVGSLAVDPTDAQAQTIYAAVWPEPGVTSGCGAFKSSDGGSTWTNINPPAAAQCGATDVIVAGYDHETLLAAFVGLDEGNAGGSGIYRSIDAGATWNLLSKLPSGTSVGGNTSNGNAIRLDSTAEAGHAYAAYLKNETPSDPKSKQVVERAATTDGGDSWRVLAGTAGSPELRSWHLLLAVDPQNAAIVLVNDGYTLWGSLDSGMNWARADTLGERPIGNDWVTATFDPTSDAFLLASDQGVADGGILFTRWQPKSSNLQVTEFYDVTPDPTNRDVIYGIAQDQGSGLKFGGGDVVWRSMTRGSELGKVLVDPTDGDRVYVADYNIAGLETGSRLLSRSDDGGMSWLTILNLIGWVPQDWSTLGWMQRSVVMDPSAPRRLLVGASVVIETLDGTSSSPSWRAWEPFPAATETSHPVITALAIAPSSPSTVYAATAMLPSSNPDRHVYRTIDSGKHWTGFDQGLPADGWAIDIQVDPSDATSAYLVGWYALWKLGTVSGTPAWTQVPGPPGLQVWSVYPQWSSGDLYVGTSSGVWWSDDAGGRWSPLGQGLPNVTVRDLKPIGASALCAGTYGRGAWAIELGGKEQMISVAGRLDAPDPSARPSWIALPGWAPGRSFVGASETRARVVVPRRPLP
jgi:hypothetical protein